MNRILIGALLACAAMTAASAQTGINQFPNVAPPVPSPGSVPNANASPLPQVAPGPAAPKPHGHASTVVQVPGYPPVVMPRDDRDRDSFSSRIERCIHYGSAAGIQPGDLGAFSAQCANR